MKKTKEELEQEIELGEKEEDPYTKEGRHAAVEDDSLTDSDEGFMAGYEQGEDSTKCATCKKILEDDFIEEEFEEETLRFCSENCAEKYEKKQQT